MKTARSLAIAASFILSASWSASAAGLPDGDGKDLVQKVCSACHDVDTATSVNQSEAEWKATIATMKSRGAEGTDAEFDTVIKYLAKNFGPKK